MTIESKESNLDSKNILDQIESLNLENPRIKEQIEYNWQTALLIKYDKKYEQYKYSVYAILCMWKIYDITSDSSRNCIINWITKDGIIISYCNQHWGWDVKWNSVTFDWEKLNKLSYHVDEIVTLDNWEKALICKDKDKVYALYNWVKSPDFNIIQHVQLFNWKLAVIWRIDERLLVSIWDQVYWKWEWWDSVKLVWWRESEKLLWRWFYETPRIEWTKKWETPIN